MSYKLVREVSDKIEYEKEILANKFLCYLEDSFGTIFKRMQIFTTIDDEIEIFLSPLTMGDWFSAKLSYDEFFDMMLEIAKNDDRFILHSTWSKP